VCNRHNTGLIVISVNLIIIFICQLNNHLYYFIIQTDWRAEENDDDDDDDNNNDNHCDNYEFCSCKPDAMHVSLFVLPT